MSDSKETVLEAIPFYREIQKKLSEYADKEPKWYEISNMLTETNEKGEFASVFGVYTAYFDKNGFVRNAERVSTHGMPTTPKITLEEVNVDYKNANSNMLKLTFISTDKNGEISIDEDNVEDTYSIFEPGKYITLNFSFTNQQSTEKKRLIYALANFYEELKKLSESDDLENCQIPVLTITAVPLLLGGRYSLNASNPLFWNLIVNDDDEKDIYPETLVVVFEKENITFYADDDADPVQTFLKCRSELASEWLKEEQQRKIEAEEKAYKEQREIEIAKLAQRNIKHTFKTSKYIKNDE